MKELIRQALGPTLLKSVRNVRQRIGFCREFGLRYARMSRFKTVQGFMIDSEAIALHNYAAKLAKGSPVAVEIGSWLGKSTIVIGTALSATNSAKLYCVDPFDASGDTRSETRYRRDAQALATPLRTAFDHHMAAAGLTSMIHVLQGKSAEVGGGWKEPIDFLFIDGDHSYAGVVADFDTWVPHLKLGGYLLFHDTWFENPGGGMTEYHTGPAQVVTERVLNNPAWEVVEHHCSLFVARRRSISQERK